MYSLHWLRERIGEGIVKSSNNEGSNNGDSIIARLVRVYFAIQSLRVRIYERRRVL